MFRLWGCLSGTTFFSRLPPGKQRLLVLTSTAKGLVEGDGGLHLVELIGDQRELG